MKNGLHLDKELKKSHFLFKGQRTEDGLQVETMEMLQVFSTGKCTPLGLAGTLSSDDHGGIRFPTQLVKPLTGFCGRVFNITTVPVRVFFNSFVSQKGEGDHIGQFKHQMLTPTLVLQHNAATLNCLS